MTHWTLCHLERTCFQVACWETLSFKRRFFFLSRWINFLHTNNKANTKFLVMFSESELDFLFFFFFFFVFSVSQIGEYQLDLNKTVVLLESLKSVLSRTCIDLLFPWSFCHSFILVYIVVVVSIPAVLIAWCFNCVWLLLEFFIWAFSRLSELLVGMWRIYLFKADGACRWKCLCSCRFG